MKRGQLYRVYKAPGNDPKAFRVFVVVSRQVLLDSRFSTAICSCAAVPGSLFLVLGSAASLRFLVRGSWFLVFNKERRTKNKERITRNHHLISTSEVYSFLNT